MTWPIVLLIPLFVSVFAACNKQEAPPVQLATPLAAVSKDAHLDANWYTKSPQALNQELNEYLELAIKKCYVEADPEAVRALVVPHAGLYYSGFCAATAYQTLLSSKNLLSADIKNHKINHIIILAPDHHGLSFGITLPHYTHYKTPLGDIQVNSAAVEALKALPLAKVSAMIHNAEHSLEMQLPWLQKTIANFTITPLIIGGIDQFDAEKIATALKPLITDSTLVVVTSDFTHHGPSYNYQVFDEHIANYLRTLDAAIIEPILTKNSKAFAEIIERTQATVCGRMPLTLLLKLLEGKHLGDTESRLCSYYTSAHLTHAREGNAFINVPDLLGDLPDSAARESVSYGAVVFTAQRLNELKPENQLTGFEKRSLTTMARESIENELAQQTHQPAQLLWPIVTPSLTKPQGVFVTLHDHDNRLRGCIGRITSLKPTYQTTQDMAIAAAFKDERFKPLTKEELDNEVHLSISILSQPERVFALSNIVLGKHGIILNKFKDDGTLLASSVFLPQVPPSMNWDLATTLAELSVKAGLPRDGWQDNCELQIFEGYEVKEEV